MIDNRKVVFKVRPMENGKCVRVSRPHFMLQVETMMDFPLPVNRDVSGFIDDIYKWQNGNDAIQDVFYYLNADEREFLLTGMTPEEWETNMY